MPSPPGDQRATRRARGDSGSATQARRRTPRQARSKQTVDWILDAAARVFRREGFAATTNRIAKEAGVSVGSLYEYFPDKQALLAALASKHVETAERGIAGALEPAPADARDLLSAIQAAITASHRYPSQAIELVADGTDLRARSERLRARVLAALEAHARRAGYAHPELRARAAFGIAAELGSRVLYEERSDADHAALQLTLLDAALVAFTRAPIAGPADETTPCVR